jgi:hypothetical protein
MNLTDDGLLDGVLSEAELATWRADGCLVLRGLLAPDDVARLGAVVDELTSSLWDTSASERMPDDWPHSVRVDNVFSHTDAFDELIDHPRVLPRLVALMGEFLQVTGAEVFVRRASDRPMSTFHTDYGPSMQAIALRPESRELHLKVQFFLTDVSAPSSGNFMYVRGSHRLRPHETLASCQVDEANETLARGELPVGTSVVQAAAGDAVIFPYSLWHGVTPNTAGQDRKTVILRYGHLWCRPHDRFDVESAVASRLTARRRRLLGVLNEGARPMDYYKPSDQQAVLNGASGGS